MTECTGPERLLGLCPGKALRGQCPRSPPLHPRLGQRQCQLSGEQDDVLCNTRRHTVTPLLTVYWDTEQSSRRRQQPALPAFVGLSAVICWHPGTVPCALSSLWLQSSGSYRPRAQTHSPSALCTCSFCLECYSSSSLHEQYLLTVQASAGIATCLIKSSCCPHSDAGSS